MIDNPLEFEIINYKPAKQMKPICKIPQQGDMIYLYLSLSQAEYLFKQLESSLKTVNSYIDNGIGDADVPEIVVTFPKGEDL